MDLPDFDAWAVGVPAAAAWAFCWYRLAGCLKLQRGWRTGYTRKVVHFTTFLTAAIVQLRWGIGGVHVFGAGASLVLAGAIWRGDGDPIYEAIARESDAPRRTLFIIIPYLTTVLGGVLSTSLFGRWALVGYLVGGLGDAVGEPIGVRFGRHRYRVPCFGLDIAQRSLEGSAAVFIASWLGTVLALTILVPETGPASRLLVALPVALASALAEAASPHGWDNLTMQVLPAWLAMLLAG